jgi:hypothetical protein
MGSTSDDSLDLGIPDILDAHKLSEGGSETVYRAHQAGVGLPVAVKVLSIRPDGADAERFEADGTPTPCSIRPTSATELLETFLSYLPGANGVTAT